MSLTIYYDHYQSENKTAWQTVVLIHGWGMHSTVWDPIVPALLSCYHVMVVDLPGMGRSPVTNSVYNLDYLVDQVVRIVPKHSVVIGWSLGGMVAIRMAAQHAESTDKLITVACNPAFVSTEAWPDALNPKILQRFSDFLVEDWEGTLIRFLTLQCKGSVRIKNDVRYLKEIVLTHGLPALKALRAGLVILQEEQVLADLRLLSQESLFVLGEYDHLVPMVVSAKITQVNSQSRVALIKGTAHIPFLTEPVLFIDALSSFLNVELSQPVMAN